MSYVEYILGTGLLLGYFLIFLTLFAETGLLIGFVLPGDSFLFALGILAGQGRISLVMVILLCCAGAIIGNMVGYFTGKRFGPELFERSDSRLFKKKNLHKAHEFYEKYGAKMLVLTRFVPVVRTFSAIIAGAVNMNYHIFMVYNIVGGIIWVVSLTLLGYFLGSVVHDIDRYILPAVILIIVGSLLPMIRELYKHSKHE